VTKIVRAEISGSDTNPKEFGHARWLVNDDQEPFDAVIVTIGTCGKPKWTHFPGMPDSSHAQNGTEDGKSYADAVKADDDGSSDDGDKHAQRGGEIYQGEIVHSSQLDNLDCEGKTVVVIGSGASGVEAIETALTKGAKKGVFIARFASLPLHFVCYAEC
jgi:cation diffusion facilitator CzcD-associated flavoprotein CzcO